MAGRGLKALLKPVSYALKDSMEIVTETGEKGAQVYFHHEFGDRFFYNIRFLCTT